jgi:peptide/nickel transport system permease protein
VSRAGGTAGILRSAQDDGGDDAASPGGDAGPWRLAWRRLRRNRRGMVGGALLLVVVLGAAAAPLLAPSDPLAANMSAVARPPGGGHLLGTDSLGRDLLSRVLYGGRISLGVGLVAALLGGVVGVTIGVVAGFAGGLVDDLAMRAMDVLLAFPTIVLAIAIVASLGATIPNTTLAIGIVLIPSYARLVRGAALSLRTTDFVEASRALGTGPVRIVLRHVLPNAMAVIVVQASLDAGAAVLTEAGLSFLGLGAQPPTPSWGSMLNEGRAFVYNAPHMATFPGLAIMLAVLGFNLLGDGLRDALDPQS